MNKNETKELIEKCLGTIKAGGNLDYKEYDDHFEEVYKKIDKEKMYA